MNYLKAFDNAWDQYADPKERRDNESQEETAHKVAWAALKQEYMIGKAQIALSGRKNKY